MSQFKGVITGQVVNVMDPDGQGRVQVSFPFLGGQNESYWAPVASLMAGRGRGSWWMPEVGDEALVAFNQNDPAHPHILGYHHNGQDTPPESDPKKRVLVTPGGHTIRFEDGEDSPKVILRSKQGSSVTLNDGPGPTSVVISSKGGLSITLDDSAAGSIKMSGGGRNFAMSDGQVQIS